MFKKGLILATLALSIGVQARVVFHEVDTQLTFWEASNGIEAGPLAVNGSKSLESTIRQIKVKAYKDPRVKAVASVDYHFDYEVQNPEIFPEFKQFGAHGMALEEGPLGAARIPEVLVYPKNRVYHVNHHEFKDGEWRLVPEKLNVKKVLDDRFEVVIRKNGLGSYSVFANPQTEKIYALLKPKAVFVYGVATDFCVDAAVKGLLARGYKTYVIEDAISGIFPDLMAKKTQEMKEQGAIFVKYSEVESLINQIESAE